MSTTISRISIYSHCNDLGGKIWNPAIRWTKKYAVFVVIEDDSGLTGLGECWCFDSAPDSLIAFLRTEVLPFFIGVRLDDVDHITQKLTQKATLTARHGILASALSGIDIAVWDLIAQQQNQPIWKSLNINGSGDIELYASGGLYGEEKTTAQLVAEMAQHVESGFNLSKMKIGAEPLDSDIARVKAVLLALPKESKLIIDGVYSYSADEALRLFDALPTERIEAFQSPTKAQDYAGMARLTKAGVPVMATEAEYRDELHLKLVEESQVTFLQTAPIACGGVSRVLELSKMLTDTPTRLSLEISSTAIALMAASHIAAADSTIAHVEYHTVHDVFFDTLKIKDQTTLNKRFVMPGDSGLGISLPISEVTLVYLTEDMKATPLIAT